MHYIDESIARCVRGKSLLISRSIRPTKRLPPEETKQHVETSARLCSPKQNPCRDSSTTHKFEVPARWLLPRDETMVKSRRSRRHLASGRRKVAAVTEIASVQRRKDRDVERKIAVLPSKARGCKSEGNQKSGPSR